MGLFDSAEELARDHSTLPHGGSVIRSGRTGLEDENSHTMEFSLKLDSNPQFTSSILVCCARALGKFVQRGRTGAFTMLDIAPADMSPLSGEELRKHCL